MPGPPHGAVTVSCDGAVVLISTLPQQDPGSSPHAGSGTESCIATGDIHLAPGSAVGLVLGAAFPLLVAASGGSLHRRAVLGSSSPYSLNNCEISNSFSS